MINYGRNYLLLVHEHDEKSFPNLIYSPKILHKSASWRGSLQAQVANQHQSTELDQICVIRTCERKLHENCTNIASYGRKLHKNCAHCIGRKMRRNCAKNCAQDTVRPIREISRFTQGSHISLKYFGKSGPPPKKGLSREVSSKPKDPPSPGPGP